MAAIGLADSGTHLTFFPGVCETGEIMDSQIPMAIEKKACPEFETEVGSGGAAREDVGGLGGVGGEFLARLYF